MNRKKWLGIILILLGVCLILNQLDIIELSMLWHDWWPMLFILAGLLMFEKNSWGTSLFFVLLGIFLIANNFYDGNLFVFIWPFVLIFIGLIFIFARGKGHGNLHTKKDLKTVAILSGAEVRSQSEAFKGGEVIAIMGGAEIDLREIIVNEAGAVLDLTAVLGGIELRLPKNCNVKISGSPILGGVENKFKGKQLMDENSPLLHINYVAILGGIEIRD